MANQNFRVKKGLEVGLGATFLYADDTGVGINSADPRRNLDVRGNAIIEQDLTVGAGIGSTDRGLTVTGLSTFNGNMTIDGDVTITGDLNFDDAFIDELNFNVGIGTSLYVGFVSATDGTIGGAGIATIGGDPQFNSLSVASTSNFGGIASFQSDVSIAGTVTVGGDIVLDDLDAGNITVGGTVFTNGLEFNVGIGTTLTLQDLSVTGIASINGAGIATIGGDPVFNSLTVTGVSSFAGIATFGSDVSVAGTVTVGGDIILDDLEAGNITVGGTVFTSGLNFNVGIGTTLTVENLTAYEAGIGTAGIGSLTVSGISSFVGFATFGGDVAIAGTVIVGGDIVLDDLESGTIKTNEIDFNIGIGSDLVITGISSLNIITGVGSELQYLPAGSISTTVGIASTIPPTVRPTGEPVQPGDLWFDSLGLRQYTYFYDGDSAQWVDSNPPPIQPNLTFQGNQGAVGQVDLAADVLNLIGVDNQVVTQTGAGETAYIGLATNVEIANNLSVGNSISANNGNFTGSVVMQGAVIGVGSITNLNVTGIAVTDLVVTNATIENLDYTTGVGTNLSVVNLDVSGIATLNGAGIATLGGNANFDSLQVTGFTTLGFTTVQNTLWVGGNLNIGGDFVADELEIRRLTVSEDSNLNELGFNVGIGSTLTIQNEISSGSSITADTGLYSNDALRVEGVSVFVGVVTTFSNLFVGNNGSVRNDLDVGGTIDANQLNAPTIISNTFLSYETATGNNLTVNDTFTSNNFAGFVTATVQNLDVTNTMDVTGVSSFVGALGFGTATGYNLTVTDLTATGSVSLPGIPVQGGDVTFRNMDITGVSTFAGISTFQDDVYIGGNLFIDGNQTFIDIDGTNINLTGIGTIPNLVSTAATIGVVSYTSAVGEDLALDTLRVSTAATITDAAIGIATVNDITVYNQLLDSTGAVGAAGSILTMSGASKLIWSAPDAAGLSTSFSPGNTFYVALNGSNDNDGSSPDKPWRTIGYALTQSGLNNGADNILTVAAGEYTEVFPLEVPAGVTIRGAGQRATNIKASSAADGTETRDLDGFQLNDRTTISDLTVGGFLKPQGAGSYNYAFTIAAGAALTNRSPYIESVTVLNPGTDTSTDNPFGYGTPDLFNTSGGNIAPGGSGALVDGSVVDSSSIEAAILFNDVTMFTASGIGISMVNGARSEVVNTFVYFAEEGIKGSTDRTAGFANAGRTRLQFTGTPTPTVGQSVAYFSPSGVSLASGTVNEVDGGTIYLSNAGVGTFAVPEDRKAKTISFVSDAQISTAQNPPLTGATSSLDVTASTGAAIAVDAAPDFGFGTGEFTVAFWAYFDASSTNRVLLDMRSGSATDNALDIRKDSGSNIGVYFGNSNVVTSTTAVALSTWYYITVTRDSSNLVRLFINGIQEDSATDATDLGASAPVEFGADYTGTNGIDGYLADLWIETGVSKYNTNFSTPSAYVNGDSATTLLVPFNSGINGGTAAVDNTTVYQDIRIAGAVDPQNDARTTLADYSQFGGDLRSIGSAVEYGNKGVVGDGPGVEFHLISINFNFVGAGGDISNDPTSAIQGNEIEATNDATISFVSIDQNGDFRVGELFYVNQETGAVSFAAETVDLTSLSTLTVSDGTNSSVITPTSGRFGDILIASNVVESVVGDMTLRLSGGGLLEVEGNVNVDGSLSATSIQLGSIANGDTSIVLQDTGTDGTIIFVTDATEAARIDNQQRMGIGTQTVRADLDVVGQTLLENLNVTGVATVGLLSAANVEIGEITAASLELQSIYVSGISTLADDGSDTKIGGDLNVVGILTVGNNSTTISGELNNEFVRVGTSGDTALLAAASATEASKIEVTKAVVTDVSASGIATVGVLTVTSSMNVGGSVAIGGSISIEGGSIGVATLSATSLNVTGILTTNDLNVTGVTTVGFLTAQNINASGIITATTLVAENVEFPGGTGIGSDSIQTVELSVSGIATVGELDVTTDATIGRNLSVAGLTTLTGLTEVSDVNVGSALTTVDLNVTGTANISGAGIATEGGDVTFNSVTTTAGTDVGTDLTVGGSATVTGQVVANGAGIGLTVANDAYVSGALTVDGDLNVTGDISYDEVTGRNLNISGVGTITNLVSTASTTEVLTVNTHADMGSINASGIATVGVITAPVGTVEILDFTTASGGSLNLSGNLVATGDVTAEDVIAQQLSVAGVSTLNSLEVTTSVDAASITITGTSTLDYVTTADALVGSALTVTGDLTVGGNLDITGDIEFDEIDGTNLNITGVSTTRTLVVLEDGSVGRNFSVAGVATIGQLQTNFLQVVGAVEIDTDLTVDRNLFVGAAATVTDSLTVNDDLIVAGDTRITGIMTAQDIDTLSDNRYKENITGISSGLYKVTQLNGVTFNWIGGTSISGGVIAQDVEAVLPEFVHNDDPKTVNYNGIIGALVEAVKELKAENDALRARVENLENP